MSAPDLFLHPQPVARATLPFNSYVDRLRLLAQQRPDDLALAELHALREVRREYTYAQMDRRCRAIAAQLQALGASGERALLACDNDPDYLLAFLACAYAGVVAVPLYAPTQRNHLERYAAIAADCGARFLLSTQAVVARNTRLGMAREDFPDLQWLLVDTVDDALAEQWHTFEPPADALCYLQYTSGSTGTPRGVMVRHAHLMYQGAYIEQACQLSPRDRALSWLPLYHDMGLIVGALQAFFTGFPLWLTTPSTVVMHPDRWLRAIGEHRISFAGAPNFVYDLCAQGVDVAALEGVDLSCWQVAFNAAEPIRASTLERFAQALAPLGLPPTAPHPAYGLAEATLAVTMKVRGSAPVLRAVCPQALRQHRVEAPGAHGELVLPSSGRFVPDTVVHIVEPETCAELAPGRVGEIWVGGSGPAQGYWGQPEDTAVVFQARVAGEPGAHYLRTGDMGFVDEANNLFVTGRLKDLIIVAGKNHYPQDIEETVEQCDPALRPHAVAAVAVERDGREWLLVLAEVQRRQAAAFDAAAVAAAIRRRIAQQHALDLSEVVFLQRGQLPMTTSGKIRRRAARERLDAGELQVLARVAF